MNIDLSERDVIHILNCLNICVHFLKYHTRDEKEFLSYYHNFENYERDYTDLMLIHRRISLTANMDFYKVDNYNLFIGQRDYLKSKDKSFKILKNNKKIKHYFKPFLIDNRKHNDFYFKNFINKVLTNLKV